MSYVIFLSKPRATRTGKGDVTALHARDRDVAAARAVVARRRARPPQPLRARARGSLNAAHTGVHEPVHRGIVVLASEGFRAAARPPRRLLTNHDDWSSRRRKADRSAARAPGVKLVALFSPSTASGPARRQGANGARREDRAADSFALRRHARPTAAMLDGIDTLVVDLQDIGARFYRILRRSRTSWRKRAQRKLPVVVLDRPNPIDGFEIEGPAQDAAASASTATADADPPRPDARRAGALFNGERHIGADLTSCR
jgi:hypothetical protein